LPRAGVAGNAGKKPFSLIRPDYEAMEYGALSPNGLLNWAAIPATDPGPHPQCRRCPVGGHDILALLRMWAVLLEAEGMPKCLIGGQPPAGFHGGESGVTLLFCAMARNLNPAAALTRWQVASIPSHADDDDWGNPVFAAQLIRHRLGGLGNFLMKWNLQNVCFETADIGAVVSAPAHRPAYAPRQRRA
jgi:hypothetical protein